jgi:hypothetical protein
MLMRSYLRRTYHRIILYNIGYKCCSEWKEIKYGVPQGSVLGPVLILLYINDSPKVICDLSKPILFADDTSTVILDKNATNFKVKQINYLDNKQMVCKKYTDNKLWKNWFFTISNKK